MPNPIGPLALTLLTLLAPIRAQCPPGAPMPQDIGLETTLAATGPAHTRLQTAMAALQKGDPAAARTHLFAALEFHPSSPALLLEVVLACGDDPDLLALWSERFVRAAADDRGRVKLGRAMRKRLDAVEGAEQLIKATQDLAGKRAGAITEIARYIERSKPKRGQNAGRALLVRWASELLLEVGAGAPQAIAEVAPKVEDLQRAFEPDYDEVYRGLADVMKRPLPDPKGSDAPTTGVSSDVDTVNDQRIRAARILVGLARQVAFKDLQGERPAGPGRYADEARKLLEDERERDVEQGRIWTIAELEAMSPAEAERFTQTHRDWHHPGLALSTTGRYRIETVCGHDTLLQTARTIELHHARLVDHYGKDPFENRQGIARIVPESSDLETEGAPYWWAGGFQSGDRTTVRFAWGTIPALGRTLTHELTHRFDGVLRPFLPSWYVEGHADWTGAHYGKMAATEFVQNHLQVRKAAHTFYKGYANKRKFERLLAGEVDDYRDNYFAGYSLYAFLDSYPPGAPRYREALAKYEKNARAGRKDPRAWFVSTFCDGKQGRPETFEELHEEWRTFVRGCYDWLDGKREDNRWIGKYGGRGKGDAGGLVMDEPTWSWARKRAEPFYGQDHAAAATLLLDEVGDVEATISAGVWSLTADGWRPDVTGALQRALHRSKRQQDAAAAFDAISAQHFGGPAPAADGRLLQALPKTEALLAELATRAQSLADDGKPKAACATARDHAELAHLFGTAPLPLAAADRQDEHVSLPRHLGCQGFTESGLTDFEERRRKGLWYVTPEGDLHVGREKPREATGVLDRRARQRDAFAHSVSWQAPGRYVLRGRVHFTTSFASGAIVFGHTRRDRDLRLAFSSGDFAYAMGKSERNERKGRVRFSLRGLWERDVPMPDTSPNQSVEIPEEQNWFEYALHITGPRVMVEINGEPLMRYAVHDGTPIEGQVGFAMGTGAIRVQQPTVQRLDDAMATVTTGLDITRQPTRSLADLMLLPTRGIPTGPDGTMVLWLTKVDPEETTPTARLGRALNQISELMENRLEHPQRWVLAAPRGIDKAELEDAVALIKELYPDELPVVEHDVAVPFDGRYPWVLFVDAQGLLRSAAGSRDVELHTRVRRWSRMFRHR